MYRFTAEGKVVKIKSPERCKKTGYIKINILLENEEGQQIAPEFNPRTFGLLNGLNEGDRVRIDLTPKANGTITANFFKALSLEII